MSLAGFSKNFYLACLMVFLDFKSTKFRIFPVFLFLDTVSIFCLAANSFSSVQWH